MLISTGFDIFFEAPGNLYLILMAAVMVIASRSGRTPGRKLGYGASVAVLFLLPILPEIWVAGTKVSITNATTSEVLAEHVWYSWEPGQGTTAGHRQPWGFAVTCPHGSTWGGTSTRMFVDQVLKPRRAD